MKINLLECTLRDGGYQVNWDFDEDFVNDYLKLCSNLDLKNIEFGFRFFDNSVWRGEFAFTTEEVINKYKINDQNRLEAFEIFLNFHNFLKTHTRLRTDLIIFH